MLHSQQPGDGCWQKLITRLKLGHQLMEKVITSGHRFAVAGMEFTRTLRQNMHSRQKELPSLTHRRQGSPQFREQISVGRLHPFQELPHPLPVLPPRIGDHTERHHRPDGRRYPWRIGRVGGQQGTDKIYHAPSPLELALRIDEPVQRCPYLRENDLGSPRTVF